MRVTWTVVSRDTGALHSGTPRRFDVGFATTLTLQNAIAAQIAPTDLSLRPLPSSVPTFPSLSNGLTFPTASTPAIPSPSSSSTPQQRFSSTVISIITGSTSTITLVTSTAEPEPTTVVSQITQPPARKISQASFIAALAAAVGVFVCVLVIIALWWWRRRRRRRRLNEKDYGSETATSPYPESTQRLNASFPNPISPSDVSTRPPSYSDTDPATTTIYSPIVSPASPTHYHYRLRRILSQDTVRGREESGSPVDQLRRGLRRSPLEMLARVRSRGSGETGGSDGTAQVLHMARLELANVWLPTTPRTAFSEDVPAYPPSPPPPLYLRRHEGEV